MKIIMRLAILVVIILFALRGARWVLLLPPNDATLENGTRLQWTNCWFDIPLTKIAYCAYLTPSLQNENNSISLPVVVFSDYSQSHKKDPVLYINGGPGNSSGINKDNVGYWFSLIDRLGWERDFIVFDHRGTGLSRPKPECKELTDFYLQSLKKSMTLEEASIRNYKLSQACYRRLKRENQPVNFSTFHNAQDVKDLTRVMDYPSWNLYALSYGTRVALEVMRHSPEKIRSVILDSVYPTDKHPLLESAGLLNSTIEMIFQHCEGSPACDEKYPDLRFLFDQALERLQKNPMWISAYRYKSEDYLDVLIDDNHFLSALYMAMYDKQIAAEVPAAIKAAVQDESENEAMLTVVDAYVDWLLDTDFNDAIYFSVECNDREVLTEKQYQDEIRRYPAIMKYLQYGWRYDPCRTWAGEVDRTLSIEPVKSTIPTLILSGEYDPVTPWQWGEEVHQALSNSYHFVFKGSGHSILTGDDCSLRTGREFLSQPRQLPGKDC